VDAKEQKEKKKEKSGPKPKIVKISGSWEEAIKKSQKKKKPPDGWTK